MSMKLTTGEKRYLKALKKDLPRGSTIAFDREAGFTVLVVPEGPYTASMTTAMAAWDEPRHYRRRGEMLAIKRYFNGHKTPVSRDTSAMELLGVLTYAEELMEGDVYHKTF